MPLFQTRFPRFSRVVFGAPLLAALLTADACLGDSTQPTLPEGSGVTVSVSQPTQQVAVNQPSLSAITIGRLKGYTGIVALSVDSLPPGVTATFDPSVLEGAATTSILALTAVDSAVAKTTIIRIKAAGSEVNTDSATVNITVVKGALAFTSGTNAVSIPQGAAGSIPLSITRSNGFLGPVTLFAEGLPANVVATFTPGLLPVSQTVSTLTLSALAGATPGTSSFTVRAKATGQADKTVTVQLTVTPSATAGFALLAAPASLSVVAGSSAQTMITAARTGAFAGTIQMSITGMPEGVTAVLTPNPTIAGATTLTVTTNGAALPGNYTLLVSGAATGQTTRVIPVGLTINAVPGVTVTLSPTSVSIARGGFAQVAVLLTRVGGLTGDLTMTAVGLPTGVTAIFSPSPVVATVTTLTLSATTSATSGIYNVVIKAAAGSDFGAATIPLTVGATSVRN